ncbi:MAG: DUF86 domain-containing protein [Desulfobacteraceae bacterium]|nr:DUF86 domain-containing protein [Desulfobacteraceae bacterium]
MINKLMIEKKLRKIETFLKEIESAPSPGDFQAFSENFVFKRFVERNIELSIEQMIDICKHFISGLDLKEPESYSECFEILGEASVLPIETVEIFRSMTKYRNLLIHSYDGVDDTITFGIYKKRLGDFRVFINAVREYIAEK